jgi:drug/metabolite transporter (DMT)-like permease
LLITIGISASSELEWHWLGVALAFVSTFVWAIYWIMNARYEAPPLPLMTWSFLFATPLVALVCRTTDGFPVWDHTTLPFGVWVGAIEMGFAFLLWSAALRRSDHAGRIGQLVFLAPFASLLLIERVLKEPVPASSWVGLIIIVAGVVVTRCEQGQGTE